MDESREGSAEITRLLDELRAGDEAAANRLLPVVYDELRARARYYLRSGRPGDTLQPTALVHEAYLKLAGQPDEWEGRTHFYAVAAIAMRQIVIDHARYNAREKRGGDAARVTLTDVAAPVPGPSIDALALGEALERLAALDERQARVVEMRYFAGMTVDEVAEALGVSRRTVEADWTFAKAWLKAELSRP
jgi:RNA polymerase sigma-70 factor, ECF subfamily